MTSSPTDVFQKIKKCIEIDHNLQNQSATLNSPHGLKGGSGGRNHTTQGSASSSLKLNVTGTTQGDLASSFTLKKFGQVQSRVFDMYKSEDGNTSPRGSHLSPRLRRKGNASHDTLGQYPFPRRNSFTPTPEVIQKHVDKRARFQNSKISSKLFQAVYGQKVDASGTNLAGGTVTVDPFVHMQKCTTLSDEDYMKVRKIFTAVDEQQNGVVSLREVLTFRQNHLKMIPTRVFSSFTLNTDGKIYFDEFLAAYMPSVPRSRIEEAIDRLEARLDQSTSALSAESRLAIKTHWDHVIGVKINSVSLQEFAMHMATPPLTEPEIVKIVKDSFGERTAVVTFDMYVHLMKDYLTYVQTDGVGMFQGLPLVRSHSVSWAALFPFTGDVSNYFDESRLVKRGGGQVRKEDGWVAYEPVKFVSQSSGGMKRQQLPRTILTPAGTRMVIPT